MKIIFETLKITGYFWFFFKVDCDSLINLFIELLKMVFSSVWQIIVVNHSTFNLCFQFCCDLVITSGWGFVEFYRIVQFMIYEIK